MLALYLTAELDGVDELSPVDTPESPYHYTFHILCTSCRDQHPNAITFTRFDSVPLTGSKGDAHFAYKCRSCKREASASVKAGPHVYSAADPPTRQQVLVLDCRGCEMVSFVADGAWACRAQEGKTKWDSIDLGDGEWYDYDERKGVEVSIKGIKWETGKA